MKLPAWWSIGASPRAKRDRVRSSRIANWRKLGYSARAGSQAKCDCVRSLYVVFSLQARRPYLFTLKTLSPMSEKFAMSAGSSSSACSSTTGAPHAECMCSSGSPSALATGMMSPSLVRAAQPPTYMPLRYSRAQRSLCVKPPLANTTARSARTRTSSPSWSARTPTTRPDSSTNTLRAGCSVSSVPPWPVIHSRSRAIATRPTTISPSSSTEKMTRPKRRLSSGSSL